MLRQYLQGMQGVDLFGILAMVIFLAYFTTMVIHTLKMKKEDETIFSNLPLEEDNLSSKNNNE